MMRKTLSILLTVMLVAALCVPLQAHAIEAHAARQPDYSRTGSISVDIETATGKTVGGGTLTAYHVANAVYDDGDNLFIYTEDFAGCNLSLDSIEDEENGAPELAASLAAYAEENGLTGTTVAVDGNGHAVFPQLTLGVYLVVQDTPAEEYEPIRPFVVTVPMWDGEQLVYDVQANPKPGTAVGMAKYDPPMEKLVQVKTGKAPEGSKFVFRMSPDQVGYPMPVNDEAVYDTATGSLTMTQNGPGFYEFGWMYFGLDDVGHTYTYKVYEVAGDEANYTYDTAIYLLTIVVTQNEETEEVLLDISYTDPEGRPVDSVKFTNVYEEPPTPPPPELPQTGQLWWPVPVLAVLGIVCVLFGWMLRRRDSGK